MKYVKLNNQTVTIASSVVAFIFAVFGFFGYRNVGKLKEDYLEELQNVRSLKDSLELEINTLRKKQEQAETEIEKLRTTQGTKIELLEIAEKASKLFHEGQFAWAIEHTKAGREINPTYKPLLSLQALCESRIGDYLSAAGTYREIIKTEQQKPVDILNYAEVLLLAKNYKDYDDLYSKNKEIFDNNKSGDLMQFFNMLRAVALDDLNTVKIGLKSFVEKCPPEASPKLGTWKLDDSVFFINAMPPGEMKTIVENANKFFMGTIAKDAMLEALNT
jgi:tetratricopeptide (TPR) repeat protein